MQNYPFILLTLLLVLTACKSAGTGEIQTWQKTLDGNGGEVIIQNRSGDLVVGTYDEVLSFDTDGSLNWRAGISNQVLDITGYAITDIIEKSAGGYALFGFKNTGETRRGMFVDMDENGNVARQAELPFPEIGDLSVLPTENGYEVLGVSAEQDEKNILSVQINHSGNITDQKIYTIPNSSNLLVSKVLISPDGAGYLFQTRFKVTTGEESTTLALTMLDPNMNKLWSTPFGEPEFHAIDALVQTTDSGYLLAGAIRGIYGWCVKFSADGAIEWNQSYDIGGPGKRFFSDAETDKKGGYVLTGSTNAQGSGATDVWIVRLDESGDLLWDKTHGGEYHDYANDIIQISDGGYALTGITSNSFEGGSQKMWVLKLNNDGNM